MDNRVITSKSMDTWPQDPRFTRREHPEVSAIDRLFPSGFVPTLELCQRHANELDFYEIALAVLSDRALAAFMRLWERAVSFNMGDDLPTERFLRMKAEAFFAAWQVDKAA